MDDPIGLVCSFWLLLEVNKNRAVVLALSLLRARPPAAGEASGETTARPCLNRGA